MKLFYISLHWDAQDKKNPRDAENPESFFLCPLRLCASLRGYKKARMQIKQASSPFVIVGITGACYDLYK